MEKIELRSVSVKINPDFSLKTHFSNIFIFRYTFLYAFIDDILQKITVPCTEHKVKLTTKTLFHQAGCGSIY